MSFVLGLDSGGSKTFGAVADARGIVLRTWKGPGLDPMGAADWQHLLQQAVGELCAGEAPAAAMLGLSMHGEIEAVSASQQKAVGALLTCPHLTLNDVEVAYDGAFPGADGVLMLAGTGSMAWMKLGGNSARIGGWGDAFGDEGSAFWIGREALSVASQQLDGRRDGSSFAEGILSACGCSADSLIDWAYGQSSLRAAVARLASHVDQMAEAGDDVAIALLQQAAEMLTRHVEAARRKLGNASLQWSYAGSVFKSRTVVRHLTSRLGSPVLPRLPPVGGALWRAAVLADWPAGEGFIRALSQSLGNPQQQEEND
jgi:N-acetylglucosamine kinase